MVSISYYILSLILPMFGFLSPGTFIDDPNVILGDQKLNCNKIVEVMPENSIFSIYIKDLSIVKNELKNTNILNILDSPEMKEVTDNIKKRIDDELKRKSDAVLSLNILESIFSDGEFGFSILEGKKTPSFVFIFQLDEKNKYAVNDLFTLLLNIFKGDKLLLEENYLGSKIYKLSDKTNNKFEVQFCIYNSFLYVTIADKNSNYLQKTLTDAKNRKNALSDNQFMDIVKKRASSTDLMFIDLNCQRLIKFLENRWTVKSSIYYQKLQALKKIGLEQLTHINHSQRINNGNFEEIISATIKSKNGIFKVLDSIKKLDKDFVKLTPADSNMVINGNIPIKSAWNSLQDTLKYIFPSEYRNINSAIYKLNKKNNSDIEEELFSGFSGPFMFLVSNNYSKKDISMILEIKDSAFMKSYLLDTFFKNIIKTKIRKIDYNRTEINAVEVMFIKLYFSIIDKHLIFTISEDRMKSIIDTISKKNPSLYDTNIQFKNVVDNNINGYKNTNYLCFLNESILDKLYFNASSKSVTRAFLERLYKTLKSKNLMSSQIVSNENQGSIINSTIPLSFELFISFLFIYG